MSANRGEDMNEREKQILYTIISHYIETGESVASRTIEKKYDIGVSSATIRNAMADLEDKGLICKMYTSSGRIPTEQGYKMYINDLMNELQNENYNDINSYVKLKSKQIGLILENVTELLSKISNQMAISLEPSVENHKIKKLELIHVNDRRAYVVAITDLGIVKTANLNLYNITSEQVLKKASSYVNKLINSDNYSYNLQDLKNFLQNVGELDSGFSDKNDSRLCMSNETNLLLCSDNLMETIKFLDDKENLKQIFKGIVDDKKYDPYEVNIIFGKDLDIERLNNCVIIFSIYEVDGERGLIGIVGSQRMNYKENIQLMNYITDILKQAINSTVVLKLSRIGDENERE